MTRRFALTIAAGVVAFFALTGAASAQEQYPPAAGTLAANETQARPGEPITITGTQCPAGSTVTISFDNTQSTTVRAGDDGRFTATVTVPANASPGAHTITATCVLGNGATRRQTVAVTVLGAAAQAGTLPRTGTGLTTPLAASAALLLGVGTVAVVATRRRRTA